MLPTSVLPELAGTSVNKSIVIVVEVFVLVKSVVDVFPFVVVKSLQTILLGANNAI